MRLSGSTAVKDQLDLLSQVDWKQIDVNLTLVNGLTLRTCLLFTLQLAANEPIFGRPHPELCAVLHKGILAKLLEYAPTAASLQPSQPRDADELLQWMAIELAGSYFPWPLLFIQLLITTLHQRSFDFDRRDASGRTLLTAFAASGHYPSAVSVASQLMRLGASVSVGGQDGRSALYIWAEQGCVNLLESLLVGSRGGSFAGLQQTVDLWERDADGRSLLACMQSKGADLRIPTALIEELQQHWSVCERPLLQRWLTQPTALIPDVALMVLDYIDGGAAVAK